MSNNAAFGMTLQKVICDEYHLDPISRARSQFESNYCSDYEYVSKKISNKVFNELGLKPIKCLTMTTSQSAKETLSPHNFLLDNGSTLSFKTVKSGDKIAPKVVGQAGLDTFNAHFEEIVGYEIKNKYEIKQAVYNNIHKMLPIFIDYLLISDYSVWVHLIDDESFQCDILDQHYYATLEYERSNFSFTRDPEIWAESTTLKYKGESIAEIQIHKNRTFKFRFISNAIIKLLKQQKETNETRGITAEKAVIDIFGLTTPSSYIGRYSTSLEREMLPTIKDAFRHLPKAIKSTGAEPGPRGGQSKCSYDFLLLGGKTLSLKTNGNGNMICPPEVGQPSAETCYYYFKDYVYESKMTNPTFKRMVFQHIDKIIPIYLNHLFDSDYLLWIHLVKGAYRYQIFDSIMGRTIKWEKNLFSFTKDINNWNESNTVKYDNITLGEFQVHTFRSCYKFRFNMNNLSIILSSHNN